MGLHIVKMWCESTREGITYLSYNGYTPLFRVLRTRFFLTANVGNKLTDVEIIF